MEINVDKKRLRDPIILDIINVLETNEQNFELSLAQLYYDFPVLKDVDDSVVIAQLLLVSPKHGVISIATTGLTTRQDLLSELQDMEANLENVFSLLYSRLIRNRNLRKSKTELAFPTNAFLFAPLLEERPAILENFETPVLVNGMQVQDFLASIMTDFSTTVFDELLATVEGAKGIVRPKARETANLDPNSKGVLANKIESEIRNFDKRQKHGAMSVLDGFQRIRGLAGSGKTVVLAMKAALTHLRNPEALIVYTFYTKSLYQHIQRLITRFYRQFDDKDPDWSRVKIIHGWGGYSGEGVYFNACRAHNFQPVTYREAKASADPFDFACKKLLESTELLPLYDYIFVDEGQDFPASFIKMCIKLSKNNRVVFAYDDLQTIFQAATPSIKDIVGVDKQGRPLVELNEDVVLDKCYRNPREILVCAHALGFGIYGRIVQMLENREQWEDIGYKVCKGDFVEGSSTEIVRPAANSLSTISESQKREDIVQLQVYPSFAEEISGTASNIKADLEDGLRPEDILVVVVDDRYAKNYLRKVSSELAALGIHSNNIHEDTYGMRDFHKEGRVTLSTVHKAKGNEAFMVYVLGIDSLYKSFAGVKERNVLFTAMTRAKGWVRISGIGRAASECKVELDKALKESPYLRFPYPSEEQLKIIKRDLAERAIRKHRAEKNLEDILDVMTPEEIRRYLEQRAIKKDQ